MRIEGIQTFGRRFSSSSSPLLAASESPERPKPPAPSQQKSMCVWGVELEETAAASAGFTQASRAKKQKGIEHCGGQEDPAKIKQEE